MSDEQLSKTLGWLIDDYNHAPDDRIRMARGRAAVAALRDDGFELYRPEERKSWKFCPMCGRRAFDEDAERPDDGWCSPSNCDAWRHTATFDHATREWVPISGETPKESE